MDIVVEAHDSAGRTSAGGLIKTLEEYRQGGDDGRANYNNYGGWDSVGVYNAPMDPDSRIYNIGLENPYVNPKFGADVWISPDGDLKFSIKSGEFPDDFAGGIIYTSLESFTKDQARAAKVPNITHTNSAEIQVFNIPFNNTEGTVSVSPSYEKASQAYAAVSLYDAFDQALEDYDIDISTGNHIAHFSNVYPVKKRGAPAKNSIFSAWVEIRPGIGGDLDITKNFNFKEIKQIADFTNRRAFIGPYNAYDCRLYRLSFKDNKFADNTYTVFIANEATIDIGYKNVYVFDEEKTKDYFDVWVLPVQRAQRIVYPVTDIFGQQIQNLGQVDESVGLAPTFDIDPLNNLFVGVMSYLES
jgi:hypothetical protein